VRFYSLDSGLSPGSHLVDEVDDALVGDAAVGFQTHLDMRQEAIDNIMDYINLYNE